MNRAALALADFDENQISPGPGRKSDLGARMVR
jgi:hypothetical protein